MEAQALLKSDAGGGAPARQIASCGEIECEFLVSPIPTPKLAPITITITPRERSVMLVDNNKPNSMEILKRAKQELLVRGERVHDEIFVKLDASNAMPNERIEELANFPGLILCGVSDCGSCSFGSSLDSLLLQRRGAAGFAILTEPFAEQIDRVTTFQPSDRRLPAIILKHPMQMLSDEELDARARQLADAAVRLLDGLDL